MSLKYVDHFPVSLHKTVRELEIPASGYMLVFFNLMPFGGTYPTVGNAICTFLFSFFKSLTTSKIVRLS